MIEYQQELLNESIELAKKNTVIVNETKRINPNYTKSINVDLSGFIDPNMYIDEYLNETN